MKQALGKGLEALIPKTGGPENFELEIERIVTGDQPRKKFSEDALKELSASIREKGVLQPLIVSPNGDGSYMLVAGERRLRAARMAGLRRVPALIKKTAGQDSLEIALIENIQREDLNPMEYAQGMERLQREFNMTQEAVADKLGKDRASVANYLRLLKLPKDVQDWVADGKLSMGHAKAVLGVENPDKQLEMARAIIKERLSVRQAEKLIKRIIIGRGTKETLRRARLGLKDPDTLALENRLRQSLGTQVRLVHKGKKGGRIEIDYYSLEQLEGILERLE
jgi:ParB family chromosome partitioning protein